MFSVLAADLAFVKTARGSVAYGQIATMVVTATVDNGKQEHMGACCQ